MCGEELRCGPSYCCWSNYFLTLYIRFWSSDKSAVEHNGDELEGGDAHNQGKKKVSFENPEEQTENDPLSNVVDAGHVYVGFSKTWRHWLKDPKLYKVQEERHMFCIWGLWAIFLFVCLFVCLCLFTRVFVCWFVCLSSMSLCMQVCLKLSN